MFCDQIQAKWKKIGKKTGNQTAVLKIAPRRCVRKTCAWIRWGTHPRPAAVAACRPARPRTAVEPVGMRAPLICAMSRGASTRSRLQRLNAKRLARTCPSGPTADRWLILLKQLTRDAAVHRASRQDCNRRHQRRKQDVATPQMQCRSGQFRKPEAGHRYCRQRK